LGAFKGLSFPPDSQNARGGSEETYCLTSTERKHRKKARREGSQEGAGEGEGVERPNPASTTSWADRSEPEEPIRVRVRVRIRVRVFFSGDGAVYEVRRRVYIRNNCFLIYKTSLHK
jgi:hypothetical protein